LAGELAGGGGRVAWAERAAELPLPAGVERFGPAPATADSAAVDFAAALRMALAAAPAWLILDEARADEGTVLWEALASEGAPRYLWTMRAPARADRLRSALTLMLHRAQPAVEAETVHDMIVRHLPFVAILARVAGTLRLVMLGEWVVEAGGLQMRPLLEWREEAWALAPTGASHALALPPDFWA